jgi:hypothetical protein
MADGAEASAIPDAARITKLKRAKVTGVYSCYLTSDRDPAARLGRTISDRNITPD